MVARPGARPHGDDDPMTRLRFHLYDAPLRRSCCCRCYADCRPHFRLGSGGGLYSAHNTFFHWCRTPSSSDPPRLRFVASTSSALPRLCPGASCASSNREFEVKKLCPKSPWVCVNFNHLRILYSRCGLNLFVCPLDKKIRPCTYQGFTPGKCVHCAWFQELNRTASW